MLVYIFLVITLWCLMKVSLHGSSILLVVYYTFNTLCSKRNFLFVKTIVVIYIYFKTF